MEDSKEVINQNLSKFVESGDSLYLRSPTRKLEFDAKIMSTMIPQNHQVSMIGFKVQAYSYLKIKRELELQNGSGTIGTVKIASSLNPDTNQEFYAKLDSRDNNFTVNTK